MSDKIGSLHPLDVCILSIISNVNYFSCRMFTCCYHTVGFSTSWGGRRGERGRTGFGNFRHFPEPDDRQTMEEEARKLLEEGIRKKLVSPGKAELPTFANGTKVKLCSRF